MATVIEYLDVKDVQVPFIYEGNKTLPIVSLQLIFKDSGSLKDGDNAGLSRLSAKLLNEGTLSYGAIDYANRCESRAIDLSVSQGKETFVYEVSSLESEFDYGVKLLNELLVDPNYSKDTVSKIIGSTKGVIASKKTDFDYIASVKLKQIMFKDTQLEHLSLGTINSIDKIKLDTIKEFISNNIILNNAIIVVGGDISKSRAKKLSLKILKNLKKGTTKPLTKIQVSKDMKDDKIIVESEQAYIYFGSDYKIDIKDDDRYKSKVASFILGSSGFGSRLMEEVRVKRGLAYSAYSRVTNGKTSSYFSGYLQTKVENEHKAIQVVKDVISNFVKNGVTSKELEAAKRFIIGSEPLRNETLSQRLNSTFMEYYQGLEFGSHQKDLDLIKELELDDLNQYIKQHNEILNTIFVVVTGVKEN